MSGLDVAVAMFVGFVIGIMSCTVTVFARKMDEEEGSEKE